MLFSWSSKEEQEEGDEAVDEEYLEAELIADPRLGVEFQYVADDGRQHGNVGHPTVVDLALGEQAEGIEAQ